MTRRPYLAALCASAALHGICTTGFLALPRLLRIPASAKKKGLAGADQGAVHSGCRVARGSLWSPLHTAPVARGKRTSKALPLVFSVLSIANTAPAITSSPLLKRRNRNNRLSRFSNQNNLVPRFGSRCSHSFKTQVAVIGRSCSGITNEPGIELWFVRHGESKNNAILNAAGGLGAVTYPARFQQDPHITEKGVQVAKANGERLLAAHAKFDLVLSSAMVRTMETAYYMFVETSLIDRVHVAPFISEVPLAFAGLPIHENMPLERAEQIKILGTRHGSALLDRLDFSLVGGPGGSNEQTLPPSGDSFLQWLHSQDMVQELRATRRAAGEGADPIRIAVVTHSHFLMKKDMLNLDKRPSNADVWVANLHVMETGSAPVLTLTDLAGWFQEAVAVEKERVESKIRKTEKKAVKKREKYEKKLGKLQEKLANGDEMDANDLEKAGKREAKYKKQIDKSQTKYERQVQELQEEKSKFVNLSDLRMEDQQDPADAAAADDSASP